MADHRPEIELYDLKKDPNEYNNLADHKKYRKVKEKLYGQLMADLAVYEKDFVRESAEIQQKAVEGSQKYYRQSMTKKGMNTDVDDEEYLEYWKKQLFKTR